MKVRLGFVSNSSSSSFVVGVKPGSALTPERLIELFKVPQDSPLFNVSKGIANLITRRAERVNEKELLRDHGYETREEMIEDYGHLVRELEAMDRGLDVYSFNVHSDNYDGIELLLYEFPFNITTEDLFIESDR
jgi:hypothetical protein